MKHEAIHYTPTAIVRFTLVEFRIMLKASKAHYDRECQLASAERLSQTGFPDTLAKCLEQAHFTNTKAEQAPCRRLQDAIHKSLKTLNESVLPNKQL